MKFVYTLLDVDSYYGTKVLGTFTTLERAQSFAECDNSEFSPLGDDMWIASEAEYEIHKTFLDYGEEQAEPDDMQTLIHALTLNPSLDMWVALAPLTKKYGIHHSVSASTIHKIAVAIQKRLGNAG